LFSIPPYRLTVCPIFYSKWRNKYWNTELTAGTIINTPGPNNIYVWFEDRTVTPFCTKILYDNDYSFTALPNYADQFDCNSYTLPADTNGGIYYSGTNKDYLFLHQAPLLQALNQYLFIKKRQQYH
jgi:hypothetical protein